MENETINFRFSKEVVKNMKKKGFNFSDNEIYNIDRIMEMAQLTWSAYNEDRDAYKHISKNMRNLGESEARKQFRSPEILAACSAGALMYGEPLYKQIENSGYDWFSNKSYFPAWFVDNCIVFDSNENKLSLTKDWIEKCARLKPLSF